MVLYKTTAEGRIPMTKEEEAQIKADWAQNEKDAKKPRPKTIEELVKELTDRVTALEKAK